MVYAPVVRIHSHSNSDRHELYRSPEELAAAREADPLPRFRRTLMESGLADRGGDRRDRGPQPADATRRRPTGAQGGARSETRVDLRLRARRSPGRRRSGPKGFPTARASR